MEPGTAPTPVRQHAGLVALVGCPSDESLLTERARLYLEFADVVVHDRLVPENILLSIAHKAIPVGKADGAASASQQEIHQILLREAAQGKLVVRLQGGDPLIFGRLGEELDFLTAHGIRFDLVTSVSAAQVAAARAAAPLTHREGGRALTILSGRPAELPLPEKLPGPDDGNLAIYMAANRMEPIAGLLAAAGWKPETPVVIGERLGYPDEWVHATTLKNARQLKVSAPAVFLVGVHHREPVERTLFVGSNPGHFLKHGPLLPWPMIKLIASPIAKRANLLKNTLPAARGILFPGKMGVRTFVEALVEMGDTRLLADKFLMAVSASIAAEMKHVGLRADLTTTSRGGMDELAQRIPDGIRGTFLFPCSGEVISSAKSTLLSARGIELVPLPFYETREIAHRHLPRIPFSRVLFTSERTVSAYFNQYPSELTAERIWLAVGPTSFQALESRGLHAKQI